MPKMILAVKLSTLSYRCKYSEMGEPHHDTDP